MKNETRRGPNVESGLTEQKKAYFLTMQMNENHPKLKSAATFVCGNWKIEEGEKK